MSISTNPNPTALPLTPTLTPTRSNPNPNCDSYPNHKATELSGPCSESVSAIQVTGEFDYVVIMEDLRHGQRIGNYSIQFRRKGGSSWETLVPPVQAKAGSTDRVSVGDRPDGHDPRDQYVGHKRIDLPVVQASGTGAVEMAELRFNCIRTIHRAGLTPNSTIYLRQFSVHKKRVPW